MCKTNSNESSLMDFRKAFFPLVHTAWQTELTEASFLVILSRDLKKDNRPQQHLGLYTQLPLAGLKT